MEGTSSKNIWIYGALTALGSLLGILIVYDTRIAFILLAALFWIAICFMAPGWSLLILGFGAPAVNLFITYDELYVMAVKVYGSMMFVFIIANLRYKLNIRNYDSSLIAVVLSYGLFFFICDLITSINKGADFLSLLVLKGSFLMPYAWFFLAAPVITRLKLSENFLLSLVLGMLIVIIGQILMLDFSILSAGDSAAIFLQNYEVVGSAKNTIAIFTDIALFTLLCRKYENFALGRYLKTGGIIIIVIGILLLFSRASYVTTIICGLYYYRKRISRRTIVVIAVIAAGLYFMPDVVWDRIGHTWSAEGRGVSLDASSETRVYLWLAAISAFIQHPFFGIGLNGLPDFLPFFSNYFTTVNSFKLSYAHNHILTMFALTGIVGGVLAIELFYQGFKAGSRALMRGDKTGEVVQLIVLASFVSSLFGEPLFDRITMIVFLMILSTVAYRAEDAAYK